MKKGKIIFWSLLGAAIIGGGYMIYNLMKKNKDMGGTGSLPDAIKDLYKPKVTTPSGSSTTTVASAFPLSKGSRGQLVKDIQNAILAKNANALPNFGADGIWGNETEAGLKMVGFPTVFQKADFESIVGFRIYANFGGNNDGGNWYI